MQGAYIHMICRGCLVLNHLPRFDPHTGHGSNKVAIRDCNLFHQCCLKSSKAPHTTQFCQNEKHIRLLSRIRGRNHCYMLKSESYVLIIAIPPDGTLTIDLTIPIQRQVINTEEGQKVGCFWCPNVAWCHNLAIQLQITSSDTLLLVYYLQIDSG